MYHSTTGRGRVAAFLIIASFLAVRGVFTIRHPSSYYYTVHDLTINGLGAIISGVVCIAYAYYLHRNPPKDDRVRLRDPKTGDFQPLDPLHHSIAQIPIEVIGPLLVMVGIGMSVWEYFHPKF